jgi:glycosyltransferase involved in cell wall biosynthesis
MAGVIRYSLIIPVYKNEDSIDDLLNELEVLDTKLKHQLEVVFVIDGSPQNELLILKEGLTNSQLHSQVIILSRNFGSFVAIQTGLAYATGLFFCNMAADLQDPIDLVEQIFSALKKNKADIMIARRHSRDDKILHQLTSNLFWNLYRKYVFKDIPKGGIDVFGCTMKVRNVITSAKEINSSLIGFLYWMGFSKNFINYKRLARKHGKSEWTFSRKIKYTLDSVYSFTDLPIRLLLYLGIGGSFFSIVISIIVLFARITGQIKVPGYTPTLLLFSFFASLNLLSFGILGSYVWRAYTNTQQRPISIIDQKLKFN